MKMFPTNENRVKIMAAANKSMDVEVTTATFLSTGFVSANLRAGGFAPRHFNRYVLVILWHICHHLKGVSRMLQLLFLLSLFLALVIPIIVAWLVGGSYIFAFSIFLAGIVFYFINVFLQQHITKRHIIKSRAASGLKIVSGEIIVGKGIIPYWVTILVMVGMGFVSSGLIIVLLLWLGIISNKALWNEARLPRFAVNVPHNESMNVRRGRRAS